MEKNLDKALWECFKVYEDSMEMEDWTDRGYNVVLTVEDWTEEKVMKAIKDFDPCHEVEIWWDNKSFRDNYNGSIREALDDMEAWKSEVLKTITASLHPKKMKTMSLYMTVRVDVSFSDGMSEEDVVAGMENLNDYEIRLDAGPDIEVDNVEICGINE